MPFPVVFIGIMILLMADVFFLSVRRRDFFQKSFERWILLHGFLIALLPMLLQPSHHTDTTHQICLGREWITGCYMFPGFACWINQGMGYLTGFATETPYVTGSLLVVVGIWSVWKLGKEYLPRHLALLSALVLTAYWYMNIGMTLKYNNNAPLLTFWLLSILTFHFALKTNHFRYWILTGVFLGISLICKYPGIILIFAILMYSFLCPDARRHWKEAGPWLSILCAGLIFVPNALYIFENSDAVRAYVANRSVDGNFLNFVLSMFTGYGIQLLICLPILVSLLPILGWKLRRRPMRVKRGDFRDSFILAMFLLPILSQILFQCLSGVAFQRKAYGASLWPLAGLVLLSYFQTVRGKKAFFFTCRMIVTFALTFLISYIIQIGHIRCYSHHPSARMLRAQEMAQEVDQLWETRYPGVRMPTSSASFSKESWSRGYPEWNLGVYSKFRPTVNAPKLGNWCTDDRVRAEGGCVLWYQDYCDHPENPIPPDLRERFPEMIWVKTVPVSWYQKNLTVAPIQVEVGFVPPPSVAGHKPRAKLNTP